MQWEKSIYSTIFNHLIYYLATQGTNFIHIYNVNNWMTAKLQSNYFNNFESCDKLGIAYMGTLA
ncbi:hypothetical protein D3X11_02960 [Streptococcus sp. X16XC17]|nr:hypothetical protein D3X11_02960 [Streptococcus sp. X16XC17]